MGAVLSFVALNVQEKELIRTFLKRDLENEVLGKKDRMIIGSIINKLS